MNIEALQNTAKKLHGKKSKKCGKNEKENPCKVWKPLAISFFISAQWPMRRKKIFTKQTENSLKINGMH